MAKKRIDITDLNDDAMAEMTEEDLNKVTGGIAIIANQSTTGLKAEQGVARYNFFEGWPSKWKGFSLDGKG